MRSDDARWTKQVTLWSGPGRGKRKRGRPKARWIDDIVKIAGKAWMRTAADRDKWRNMEEAYTQQGT
ncbi:hypothetical protein RR48_05835 [Papilio machaon]|uniref:Uncharacterized protein n=1 Tax=Papilio machaon TaxID=76193 RepID=A0A0N1I5H0_PAPMA|nr:hypothetical protein RR48_05835 [Papilio machaon]